MSHLWVDDMMNCFQLIVILDQLELKAIHHSIDGKSGVSYFRELQQRRNCKVAIKQKLKQ
jgi:hypothetical protein